MYVRTHHLSGAARATRTCLFAVPAKGAMRVKVRVK